MINIFITCYITVLFFCKCTLTKKILETLVYWTHFTSSFQPTPTHNDLLAGFERTHTHCVEASSLLTMLYFLEFLEFAVSTTGMTIL